jgi:probable F420-dependent oxidoreductase
MQIGVTYPQTDMQADPGAVKHFAQAVEQMGYTHILAYDHVVGANTDSRPGWNKPYSIDSQFHDPFNLFSFMAGCTEKVGFVTGILILPQRQTVLVAKQTACLDVLSKGRFRLGIGIGWNELEFEALGVPWEKRAKRMEEQVEVMRKLWTQRAVTFKGEYHSIPDVGLKPLPVTRPVPIWFGGGSDRPNFGNDPAKEVVMRRIARLGDGWIPQIGPRERGLELWETMKGYLKEYGRDPKSFGLEVGILANRANQDKWADHVQFWRKQGATHLVVNQIRDGLQGVDAHLTRLEEVRKAIGVS